MTAALPGVEPRAVPLRRMWQLRIGLHALVATLGMVVLVRAAVLSQPHAVAIALLVAAFLIVHVTGVVRRPTGAARVLWLTVLAVLWLALDLVGADAAYVSLGLFLLAFTELPLPWAVAGVVAITATDIGIGLASGSASGATVLGPLLGAVIAALLGLGFRVLFSETKRRQDLIDELRRTRTALAQRERTAGEISERERLAREIHDTIAQGLGSIHMLLHAAEGENLPPRANQRVMLARTTAAAALADARRLVAALSPADLDARSLAEALARVCERAEMPVRLVIDGDADPLPMPIEAALVRIAQGALANVARHANARSAVVTLTYDAGHVHLDVVDDGGGFDVAVMDDPAARSFGLRSMRHRVEELAGEWSIESEAGRTALGVSFSTVEAGT